MTSPNSIIALLTDFGADSYYVAQMKGVLVGLNSAVQILDVTHSISPQNIRQAAYVLNDCVSSFPVGTIFVVVVDPGVGTDRGIICVEHQGRIFVCPDNGLLSVLLRTEPKPRIVRVRQSLIDSSRSNTFHGRDVMAPIAATISKMTMTEPETLAQFGSETELIDRFDVPTVSVSRNEIHGEFVYSDSFGNLITNVHESLLSQVNGLQCTIRFGGMILDGIDISYAAKDLQQPIAVIGSNGCLEIAVNGGNAVKQMGNLVGQSVRIGF